MICKNCGVELDENMLSCPLCGRSVNESGNVEIPVFGYGKNIEQAYPHPAMSQPQKKLAWEIITLVLASAAIATFLVDFIISRGISWSEYPVAISLTIFCYVSMFAFWHRSTMVQLAGGFLLSSLCMLVLDAVTSGIQWSVRLGIPLLFICNIVIAVLLSVIRLSKYKGINLVAYVFLGVAILCIAIEGILSLFTQGTIDLWWSVIVSICVIPVVLVLLFVHFRLKKGRSLEKTFHV